jgi:hypothetical protein
MKTLGKFLFFAACISLFVTCQKSDQVTDDMSGANLKSAHPITITVPFEANFMGTYMEGTGPCPECGPWDPENGDFWGIVINEPKGTGTQLGKFTGYFEFCCNFMTGIYPGNHMKAYFIAANGDTLFVACAGQVITGRLDYHPADVNSYFKDPFVILGGTGRFEGASGSGYTDDYNRDSYPDNSFHHWTGTITLVKGNK